MSMNTLTWITACEGADNNPTPHELAEYNSGYLDGIRGLSYVPGESDDYQQGYHAGATARARGEEA